MPPAEPSPVEELIQQTQADLEQIQRDLKEIRLMVTQSRSEVEKLTQRNTQVNTRLRQIQATFDTVPRQDIKEGYEAAQDTLQRLFTMRGQLEKLQADQANLEKMAELLERMIEALRMAGGGGGGGGGGATDGKPMIVRVVEAQEAERQRLSRQIHDGPAQALSNFILQAEIAARLFDKDAELARQELANLRTSATTTLQKVRDFIFDLRPMMLDDLGLVPTVKKYTDAFKEKSGLQTTLNFTGNTDNRLEPVREIMIFRGIQELLGNIRNHAQASQVRITFDMDETRVRTVVEDNGKGFDVEQALSGPRRTIGLASLKERVELLGGRLEIESQPGQGTRIVMEMPTGG